MSGQADASAALARSGDGRAAARLRQTDESPARIAHLAALMGLILALGYLIVLGAAYRNGEFLTDAHGRPIANDFVNVLAAGRLALAGDPASAYDWPLHKAAEVRAVGHPFANYYGWHYPPTFLFVAAALATLPYLAAACVWLAATLAAQAIALRGILRGRAGIFLALGFPAALWNVTAGQNGFLTAALIAGALGLLERRPALAGLCLGLLSYKPQFGLLFPLLLLVDRRWKALAAAALVALALVVAAWLAFGTATFAAFARATPQVGRVVLGDGAADWNRLQSLFGLMRAHGAGEAAAWAIQALGSLAVAAGLAVLWRSRAAYDLKAAALAAGALLVTPYAYIYDCVILAVAVAFLLRHALAHGLATADSAGLACAGALVLIYPGVQTQVGLAAAAIVLAVAGRRAVASLSAPRAAISPLAPSP